MSIRRARRSRPTRTPVAVAGGVELIAAILILIPATTWLGVGLALAVMGRRDFQSSHRARHRCDGRWRTAVWVGACCRRLQHLVAVFTAAARSWHRSLSMKRCPLQDAIAEVLRQGESLLNSLRSENTRANFQTCSVLH